MRTLYNGPMAIDLESQFLTMLRGDGTVADLTISGVIIIPPGAAVSGEYYFCSSYAFPQWGQKPS
ncbi:MAG: hypothetical protein AB7E47_12610 [Desulfovibrionaceae bacterium]